MKHNSGWMRNVILAGSLTGLASLLVFGCSTDGVHKAMRTNAIPVSNFLPNHELLVEQPATFPFHFFYLDEKASVYDNVYVAPVNVDYLKNSDGWSKFDEVMAGNLGAKVDELCDFTRKAYKQSFEQVKGGKRLKVVDCRDLPKTLVLEPAIIAIQFTKAELAVLGAATSLVVPVIGPASLAMSAGSVTVECRVRDAKTGKIVAMYADTEKDPKALIPVANLTWTRSTRINLKSIAEQTAKVLSAKDYRTIRRDFPVRLISKIKDSEL